MSARKPRRLPPQKAGDPTYRQIWRVVDGAVASALQAHPDYLAQGARARTVRNSIVKRVAGALHGYAEQSAWVRSGSSPADVKAIPDLSGVAGDGVVSHSRDAAAHGVSAGGALSGPSCSQFAGAVS